MKKLGIILALLVYAVGYAPSLYAQTNVKSENGTTFELETYKDPDGRITVDLPKGWTEDTSDGTVIYMSKGLVSFSISEITGGTGVTKLMDSMPKLIDALKSSADISDLQTVEKPVIITNAKIQLAHAKLSYTISKKVEFISDVYVVGGSDGTARYGLATYMPSDSQANYRSLFESIVRSISISGKASSHPTRLVRVDTLDTSTSTSEISRKIALETFTDPDGLFTVEVPSGWHKKDVSECTLALTDNTASIGLMDTAVRHRDLPPIETLPEVIGQLREQSETFTGLRVVEKPALIKGTNIAHAVISYRQSDKSTTMDLYVIGTEETSREVLMAHSPSADRERYVSLFDRIARSVVLGDITNPVKEKKADLEVAPGEVTRASQSSIYPLYWIRNDEQIIRNGKVILSDAAGITSARISWDGKLIAYSRNHTAIVLANLSTGKRIKLAGVSGDVTVNYKEGGNEHEVVIPVGFSPDNSKVYFIKQLSSLFVGGNVLQSISIKGGKPSVEYKGLMDAAISKSGDMLICKPGSIMFDGKNGDSWEMKPHIRSMFLMGAGFTCEGKPFYYTNDSVRVFDSSGTEVKLNLDSSLSSKPVVIGSVVVWDNRGKIVTNQDGAGKPIDIKGANGKPFK